ncbi:MAG: DUF3847 domain-containing protein [Oscillospiraceae bacterium]|nr:DUF3847 domain-containing protein [Oscillospiraceae bacterium]
MSVKRTRSERISAKREQIIQMQNDLKRLESEDKAAERKARTKRLCRRGGFLESVLPDTIILSDERFEAFVKKHIANEHGLRMLNKFKAEQERDDTDAVTPDSAQTIANTPEKPTQPIENNSNDKN